MELTEEQKFIKGFNAGYVMQQHESDLLSQILKEPNRDSEYMKGLEAGKKEYLRERMQSKLQDKDKDRTKDRER